MPSEPLVLGIDASPSHSGAALLTTGERGVHVVRLAYATEVKRLHHPPAAIVRDLADRGIRLEALDIAVPKADELEVYQARRMQRHAGVLARLLDQWPKPDLVVVEGFAFAVTSRSAYDSGGIGWAVRLEAMRRDLPLRQHDPSSLKLHATEAGNADKDLVAQAAFDSGLLPSSLRALSGVHKAGETALGDMADAAQLAHLGLLELLVRRGVMTLADMSPGTRRVFLRVTKSNPVNLLDRRFLGSAPAVAGGLF